MRVYNGTFKNDWLVSILPAVLGALQLSRFTVREVQVFTPDSFMGSKEFILFLIHIRSLNWLLVNNPLSFEPHAGYYVYGTELFRFPLHLYMLTLVYLANC